MPDTQSGKYTPLPQQGLHTDLKGDVTRDKYSHKKQEITTFKQGNPGTVTYACNPMD